MPASCFVNFPEPYLGTECPSAVPYVAGKSLQRTPIPDCARPPGPAWRCRKLVERHNVLPRVASRIPVALLLPVPDEMRLQLAIQVLYATLPFPECSQPQAKPIPNAHD